MGLDLYIQWAYLLAVPKTPHTSYRLSEEAKDLLAKLSARFGLNRTAVLEMLIRLKATEPGVLPKPRTKRAK